MSKFYQALEQARRDGALRAAAAGTAGTPVETVRPEPPPVERPAPAPDPDGLDERLVSLVAPAAFEAEQYRALRLAVEQMHRAGDLRVVAVSSPGHGDGKTLTAVNLAGALAQSPEARVLLVDADLRRPALGRLLGAGDAAAAHLVGAIADPSLSLDAVARPRPPFNIAVMHAGPPPASPYEVLKSPRLGELFAEARRRYDYVIVDTPPLVPVQDCGVIGRWVDGFLIVVAAHLTPRPLLERALASLDRAKVVGIVFNQEDPGAADFRAAYDRRGGPPAPRMMARLLGRVGRRARAAPGSGRARRRPR